MSRHMFRLVTIALARLAGAILLAAVPALAQEQSVTVRAARVLDGKGASLANATVEIRSGKIVAIDQRTGPVTHDLGDVTLMPGLIDVHVHIGYHFGKDGRAENEGETPAEMALYAAENAWTTLINGFTTVQSLGEARDLEIRAALAKDGLPGPRILTSVRQINERTGGRGNPDGLATPEQLRQAVREAKKPPAPMSSSSSRRPAFASAEHRR